MENEYKFAVSNFKKAKNSKMYKFKYMHNWCFEYSKFLIGEVNHKTNLDTNPKLKKYYKKYEKGTIVYVKLGINIGNEFSGNHFCVVLNKKDSIYNPILTVVPLTSSGTKFNILIKENILQLASSLLHKQANNIAEKFLSHSKVLYEIEGEVSESLKAISDELQKDSEKLFKVYDRYERYEQEKTYANILNITTISKDRISKINKYDPSGEIQYSDEVIEMIDTKVKNRFLNI